MTNAANQRTVTTVIEQVQQLRLQHARRLLRQAEAQLRKGVVPDVFDHPDNRLFIAIGTTLRRHLPRKGSWGSGPIVNEMARRLGPGWSGPKVYAILRLASVDRDQLDLDATWSTTKRQVYGPPKPATPARRRRQRTAG